MTCSAKMYAILGLRNPKTVTTPSAANGRHQPQFREVNLPDLVKKVLFYQYWIFLHLSNITSSANALYLIFHSQSSHRDSSNSSSILCRNSSLKERVWHELVLWCCNPNRSGVISFKATSMIFRAISSLSHWWLKANCIADSIWTHSAEKIHLSSWTKQLASTWKTNEKLKKKLVINRCRPGWNFRRRHIIKNVVVFHL